MEDLSLFDKIEEELNKLDEEQSSLQRRPEWSEIKTGHLLYLREENGTSTSVVTEKLDNSFSIRTKSGGKFIFTIDEFHEDTDKFIWAYQNSILLTSTKSRGILRPWRTRFNVHASVKNWRLF